MRNEILRRKKNKKGIIYIQTIIENEVATQNTLLL